MSEHIKEITQKEFQAEVLDRERAVVDFYSTECPPCEAFALKYERAAKILGNDVPFFKVFRQGNRELAEEYGVKSSPTVLFFKKGKALSERLSGAITYSSLVNGLLKLAPEKATAFAVPKEKTVTEIDVIILGAGPAGLTAGIYLAQAKLNAVIVDTALPGGYVTVTHEVSNYPGFPEAQKGFMLGHYMYEQARLAGCVFRAASEITGVDLEKKTVELDGVETLRGRFVIVATGSRPRPLGVPGEDEYRGKGISYCATCDAKYYEGKDVLVVGGGNSAVEEAMFIAKFAKTVTIVHQFDELTARKQAVDKARAVPSISFLLGREPRRFARNNTHMYVDVEELATGTRTTLEPHGVFIFAGFIPNTQTLKPAPAADQYGYLVTDESMLTNLPGVYAVGDVRSKKHRQITTAVADATIAAIEIAAASG
jgi:thioredoxin reductase (NADPH)